MRAMILDSPGRPLRLADVPRPEPGPGQVLLKVHSCGVCRTDLHIVDGELTEPKLPLILGHQIVGTVVELGPKASESTDAPPETDAPRVEPKVRVGVPWLGWTDGTCPYCLSGRENLCDQARFTGYDIDGGYAEYAVADAPMPSPARAMTRASVSPSVWGPTGPEALSTPLPNPSTRPSSWLPWATWFPRPSGTWPRAGWWSAAGST